MKIKKIHNKGNHLIIDGFSNAELDNKKFIKELMLKLTKQIKTKPITPAIITYHKAKAKQESGVTGLIGLAESSITIHTYPYKKWFCLDIFTCNEFNTRKTIEFLKKQLKITKYKTKLLKRGFY